MNLNKKEEEKSNTHAHNPIKHMLHMIICCGLPMVIIVSLPWIARYNPAVAGMLGVIAPFICPIMMGGMMLMMFGKRKNRCCNETKVKSSTDEIATK